MDLEYGKAMCMVREKKKLDYSDDTVIVLLSSYNGEEYIREQLDSIKGQKCIDVVCIIRDDGSVDGTLDILGEYCENNDNFHYIRGKNKGVVESFNSLLNLDILNNAKWFCFSDQDDIWIPNKLKGAVEKLKKCDEDKPAVYCSDLIVADHRGRPVRFLRGYVPHVTRYSALVQNCATGCTMVFNRSALMMYRKGLGSHMEMHDYWMYLVAVFLGHLVYDRKACIFYRQHEDNLVGGINSTTRRYAKNILSNKGGKRMTMLSDFLEVYGEELSEQSVRIIKNMVSNNKNLLGRIKMLLDCRYRGYTMANTFGFKFRFLIGKPY